ncbi:MAG: protein jag [Streptococcaceae bacterium]|jgi:spoIIIJ-associated protein|nr:protein jag [Streptococcaceae bacterium]
MTIYTGNTVEEAINRGLKRERLARENAHIEIEQRESNGFLGVGKKRARVNVEPINADTVRRADRLATRGVDESDMGLGKAESAMEATLRLNQVVKAVREAGIQDDENLTEEEKQERIEALKEQTSPKGEGSGIKDAEDQIVEPVTNYLTAIIARMDIPVTITTRHHNGSLIFDLNSDQDALLIGHHGKILHALDTLAKSYTNVLTTSRLRVTVNVGDYQEKRENYLTRLAKRAAERALDGETVYINELPASERRIVHGVISEIDGVNSHSEGRDNRRYIVVSRDI